MEVALGAGGLRELGRSSLTIAGALRFAGKAMAFSGRAGRFAGREGVARPASPKRCTFAITALRV